MTSVSFEEVSKVYHERKRDVVRAVDSLTLAVNDRELLVLVGPSGCGKTTTLRLVAGLEELTAGRIRIGERIVNDVEPKDRDVAMVFQNYALYPHMTVYNNLAFGLKMRRIAKKEIEPKVRAAAAILNIAHLLDRRPASLSGGEKQRVAVGRAIVRQPKVFLFDEPLSNLDARLRLTTRTEIKALHRRLETTMLYVTHDQEEAMTMGDRLVVMKDGAVRQCGTPMEIYDRPADCFVAGFIGSPPMNFIEGRLGSNGSMPEFVGPLGGWPLPIVIQPRDSQSIDPDVILGIRPEHIWLNASKSSSDQANDKGLVQLDSMVIQSVEPVGSAMNIQLLAREGSRFVAQVMPDERWRVGMNVPVALDLNRAHLFRAGESGPRI